MCWLLMFIIVESWWFGWRTQSVASVESVSALASRSQTDGLLPSSGAGITCDVHFHCHMDFLICFLLSCSCVVYDKRMHVPRMHTVVISIRPLGRFLASMFSILSCFLPFSLILHTTLLWETHLPYLIVFFLLVFLLSSHPLSSPPLSPPSAGFHLWVYMTDPVWLVYNSLMSHHARPLADFLQIKSVRLLLPCTSCSTTSIVFMSLQLIFSECIQSLIYRQTYSPFFDLFALILTWSIVIMETQINCY